MALHDLKPSPGSRTAKKRIGRGPGSGTGKTSGKGHKGQKARSGGSPQRGFEGGQMPLYRRLPKRGFSNHRFKDTYELVNVTDLSRFEAGAVVDPAALKAAGLVSLAGKYAGVKILGEGDVSIAVTVKAAKFSKTAVSKIEAAGGSVEVV